MESKEMAFSSITKLSATEQIVDKLKTAIFNKELSEGMKLPPERTLAEQFHVSRPVVREALKELSAYGLIEMRQGEGNFVRDSFQESVLEFVGLDTSITKNNFVNYIQARLVIEQGVVPYVIDQVSDAKIREMRDMNDSLKKEQDMEAGIQLDLAFHKAFVALANNPLISEIYNIVMKPFANSAQYVLFTTGMREDAGELHERILDALEKRSVEACKEAVEYQLLVTQKNLFKFYEEKRQI